MEIGKKTLFIIALALVLAAIGPVGAYTYFFQTEPKQIPTGIILQTPQAEMRLEIYWDSYCTQKVTTIDFGKMWYPNEPTTLTKDMYIRNEGNVSHTVYWNSTLSSETANITDSWKNVLLGVPLNGTIIPAGNKHITRYKIDLEAWAPIRSYNWNLTVWAEHVY